MTPQEREEVILHLMSVLRGMSCRYCHALSTDQAAHEAVCLLRGDEETGEERRELVLRERFGRPLRPRPPQERLS